MVSSTRVTCPRSSFAGSSSTTITWCPRSCRSNARCRPMLPAPATTILMDSLRHRLQQQVELVGGVLVHDEVSHVALLERGVVLRDEPGPPSLHADHLDLTIGLDGSDLLPHQVVGQLDLEVEQEPTGQRVAHRLLPVEQEVLDLFGCPPHAGHGGDVELLVDICSPGVVDPGDHLRHLEVLSGHPGRHDIRVVAVRHRDECVGVADPGLLQDLPIEPEAHDRLGLEPGGKSVERFLALVDDGAGPAGPTDGVGTPGAHPAPQGACPAGVLLGPAVLRGVRHRGDDARARDGRRRGPESDDAAGRSDRPGPGHRGDLVPADGPGLPSRWWLLHRGPREPGDGAGPWGRRRELGGARPHRAAGSGGPGVHRGHRAGEPAGRPRVRNAVRRPHLRVRGPRLRHDRFGAGPVPGRLPSGGDRCSAAGSGRWTEPLLDPPSGHPGRLGPDRRRGDRRRGPGLSAAAGAERRGLLFFVLQIFTALILIVAANTAYQDFPRLSAILAGDRFVPSQFRNRGDRLVFSNGVIVLSLLAALLVWAFDASLTSLIPLYLVGVFTAFTLSQAGMVRRWVSRKEPRWVRNAVINAIGATTTGIVLVVAIITRFREGAWMVVAAIPVIVLLFLGVKRHYDAVARELNRGKLRFGETGRNHVVFVITGFGAATAEALGYIRSLRPASLEPLYVGRGPLEDAQARWSELAGDAPPLVVPGPRDPVDAVIHFVRGIPRAPEDFITVVIPELFRKRSLVSALMMPVTFRLKVRLLREPQVVITDVPVLQEDGQPQGVAARSLIPERVEALVFVAMPHDAAVRAVNYAVSLNAHEIRAVFLATDPEEAPEVLRRWAELGIDVRLEIVDAPFRDLGPPLLNEVRRVTADAGTVAAVVIPEFLVTRWWHRLLHNIRALFIKRQLLFEPRVILSSVPYQLRRSDGSR